MDSVIYCGVILFIQSKQCLPQQSKINNADLSLFSELGIPSQNQFCL